MGEWFEEHFQEDYLKIYAHRDEQEAAQAMERLLSFIDVKAGDTVLDLCCGQGRHSRWLAEQGFRVIGVDLSAVLLQKAIKDSLNMPVQYMRSDVRKIGFDQEMDAVVNLFTSFGYFSHEDNERVLARVYQALKPGGYFILDYLNPAYVKENLEPYTYREIEELEVSQYREIADNQVQKRIVVQEGGTERQYTEKVKLYSSEQLTDMLERNGFNILHLLGDYKGSKYQGKTSSRMIFICQK